MGALGESPADQNLPPHTGRQKAVAFRTFPLAPPGRGDGPCAKAGEQTSMSCRDDDLDDEIRQHLRMAAEDRGEEAARREFGNVALIKEVTREMWRWTSLERFTQDLRYAFRCMRRNPAFTLTALLSLALGIGANTAIFTLIDALLLRSLPVHDPQRLVRVIIYQNGKPSDSFSYPVVRALADGKELFSALAGFSGARFNVGSVDSVE